jgi:hypothetical protein
MIADQWIKTLNARLTGCPSVRGKIGYGLLILAVGSVTAVVFVAVKLLQGVLFLVSGTIKNLWNGNYDSGKEDRRTSTASDDEDEHELDGYTSGPQGFGMYSYGSRIDSDD